jgi:hypothetical protein
VRRIDADDAVPDAALGDGRGDLVGDVGDVETAGGAQVLLEVVRLQDRSPPGNGPGRREY